MEDFGPFNNTILRNLDPDVIRRLHLTRKTLSSRHEIEFPGNEIRNLYFVESGIASMTVTFQDGAEVEVGLFGPEGVTGISVLIGTKRSLNRIYMQSEGAAFTCPVGAAVPEFRRAEAFHDLVLRYGQAQLIQTAQTAACNARHSIPQRLARWLLLCHERMGTPALGLTQEFLGHMLGVRRTSVQLSLENFRDKGLINTGRGHITILDRAALEKRACECFQVVAHHLSNYTEVEQGAF